MPVRPAARGQLRSGSAKALGYVPQERKLRRPTEQASRRLDILAVLLQSTPLFPQGFQTGKPLAFCGWLAEKGVLEGPLFLIFQQLVPG